MSTGSSVFWFEIHIVFKDIGIVIGPVKLLSMINSVDTPLLVFSIRSIPHKDLQVFALSFKIVHKTILEICTVLYNLSSS